MCTENDIAAITHTAHNTTCVALQVWEEALVLYAVNMGAYDDVAVADALRVERGMREYLKTHHADLIETIEAKKELSKDVDAQLKAAIESFKKSGAY